MDTDGPEQSSPIPRTCVPATTLSSDTVATHRVVGMSTEVYVKVKISSSITCPTFHCSVAPWGTPTVGHGICTERLVNVAEPTKQKSWRSVGDRPCCGWVPSIRGPIHFAGPTLPQTPAPRLILPQGPWWNFLHAGLCDCALSLQQVLLQPLPICTAALLPPRLPGGLVSLDLVL